MWLVGGIVLWFILLWIISVLLLFDFWVYYGQFNFFIFLLVFLFGVMWGIGNINYGLIMCYFGMLMGIGIVIGIMFIVGMLMMFIINGNFDVLIYIEGGCMMLFGVFVVLIGVGIVMCVGQLKECKMGIKVEEFNLKKGFLLVVMCGIFLVGMFFVMNVVKLMYEVVVVFGVDLFYVVLLSYVVIMGGGVLVNFGFCFICLVKV